MQEAWKGVLYHDAKSKEQWRPSIDICSIVVVRRLTFDLTAHQITQNILKVPNMLLKNKMIIYMWHVAWPFICLRWMNYILPLDLEKSPTLNLTWLLWWSLITSFKLCIILLLDGWGWWSLGEVNIWVLSDYNGPRFSTLGLTSKSFKNRFHPQIKFQTYFFFSCTN